jgi:hypothetical protein
MSKKELENKIKDLWEYVYNLRCRIDMLESKDNPGLQGGGIPGGVHGGGGRSTYKTYTDPSGCKCGGGSGGENG